MANILEISLDADLLKPGEIYILHENDRAEDDAGPIEYVCFIKSADEIMPAIKMMAEGVMQYEIKEYLGCTRVSEDCVGFTMRCFDTRKRKKLITRFIFIV